MGKKASSFKRLKNSIEKDTQDLESSNTQLSGEHLRFLNAAHLPDFNGRPLTSERVKKLNLQDQITLLLAKVAEKVIKPFVNIINKRGFSGFKGTPLKLDIFNRLFSFTDEEKSKKLKQIIRQVSFADSSSFFNDFLGFCDYVSYNHFPDDNQKLLERYTLAAQKLREFREKHGTVGIPTDPKSLTGDSETYTWLYEVPETAFLNPDYKREHPVHHGKDPVLSIEQTLITAQEAYKRLTDQTRNSVSQFVSELFNTIEFVGDADNAFISKINKLKEKFKL